MLAEKTFFLSIKRAMKSLIPQPRQISRMQHHFLARVPLKLAVDGIEYNWDSSKILPNKHTMVPRRKAKGASIPVHKIA